MYVYHNYNANFSRWKTFVVTRSFWNLQENFCGCAIWLYPLLTCMILHLLLLAAKILQQWKSSNQLILFHDSMSIKVYNWMPFGKWLAQDDNPWPRDWSLLGRDIGKNSSYTRFELHISTGLDQSLHCCPPFYYNKHFIITTVYEKFTWNFCGN